MQIDWNTVLYYGRDIIVLVFLIGTTIYNIIQDRRTQALKDELDMTRDSIYGILEGYNDEIDGILNIQSRIIDGHHDLLERMRRCEKRRKKDGKSENL